MIYEEPIIKRRNPQRKGNPMQCFDTKRFMKNVGDSYDFQFIKQVPMHPRDRLARATENGQRDDDDNRCIKQVSAHPRDRLRRKTKTLKQPRDRMREKELKIAREIVSALMGGNLFLIQKFF